MKPYPNHSLKDFLKSLSAKAPVPGGGSAAALTAALGAALIAMAIRYSVNRGSPRTVETRLKKELKKVETIRQRLLTCVDRDAKAYLKVVKTRKGTPVQRKAALEQARAVPLEVCRLSYQAVEITPFLVKNGNPHLVSDIEVAAELLLSAFRSAMVMAEVNQ